MVQSRCPTTERTDRVQFPAWLPPSVLSPLIISRRTEKKQTRHLLPTPPSLTPPALLLPQLYTHFSVTLSRDFQGKRIMTPGLFFATYYYTFTRCAGTWNATLGNYFLWSHLPYYLKKGYCRRLNNTGKQLRWQCGAWIFPCNEVIYMGNFVSQWLLLTPLQAHSSFPLGALNASLDASQSSSRELFFFTLKYGVG